VVTPPFSLARSLIDLLAMVFSPQNSIYRAAHKGYWCVSTARSAAAPADGDLHALAVGVQLATGLDHGHHITGLTLLLLWFAIVRNINRKSACIRSFFLGTFLEFLEFVFHDIASRLKSRAFIEIKLFVPQGDFEL